VVEKEKSFVVGCFVVHARERREKEAVGNFGQEGNSVMVADFTLYQLTCKPSHWLVKSSGEVWKKRGRLEKKIVNLSELIS
jgi:hypothetical protein